MFHQVCAGSKSKPKSGKYILTNVTISSVEIQFRLYYKKAWEQRHTSFEKCQIDFQQSGEVTLYFNRKVLIQNSFDIFSICNPRSVISVQLESNWKDT